jgi:hypothetical protein
VSSFVGRNQGVVVVPKYDKMSLYPMLIKCYEHLHPFVRSFANEGISDQDCNLDIFKQTTNINELTKELVKKELLLFKHYQLDVEKIKCPLLW